jgi:uncharacterized membrane protein
MDFTGSVPIGWASRVPRSWLGMSGYLAAGVFLGLILILALSLTRSSDAAAAGAAPDAIVDNVVRLHGQDIGASCWHGATASGPARITVSLEVGVDGKVRYAAAAGESASMRSCVEAHVKSWEFLPQAEATTMVLPFEIDRR